MEEMTGQLLVATPILEDPHFYRTVVLVFDHSDAGAMGVVLNRDTGQPVVDHLPDWAPVVSEPGTVNYGGPVDPAVAIALGQSALGEPTGVPGLTLLDLSEEPGPVSGSVRIYSGYSGWGAEQLEEEVGSGAWYVVKATPDDPFRSQDAMWRDVLKRQPSHLSIVSTFPEDPSLN